MREAVPAEPNQRMMAQPEILTTTDERLANVQNDCALRIEGATESLCDSAATAYGPLERRCRFANAPCNTMKRCSRSTG